jgi:hypothetical protein
METGLLELLPSYLQLKRSFLASACRRSHTDCRSAQPFSKEGAQESKGREQNPKFRSTQRARAGVNGLVQDLFSGAAALPLAIGSHGIRGRS